MAIGNYNTDVSLWKGARNHYKERQTYLMVVDGHIFAGAEGAVARFDDDKKACECLDAAGYTRQSTENIIYKSE